MASFRKRGSTWEYRIVYTDRQTRKQKEKSKAKGKVERRFQNQT